MKNINLFCCFAMKIFMDNEVIPLFEKNKDVKLNFYYGTTADISSKVRNNDPCDIVIGVSDAVIDLTNHGFLIKDSSRKLAKTKLGVAISDGYPLVDISSIEQFKEFMLSARSVCYSMTGASGIYFYDKMESLGIIDNINKKATIIKDGFTALKLISGEADVAIQQISELMIDPSIKIIDDLPFDFQKFTVFTASVCQLSKNKDASRTVLDIILSDICNNKLFDFGLIPCKDIVN